MSRSHIDEIKWFLRLIHPIHRWRGWGESIATCNSSMGLLPEKDHFRDTNLSRCPLGPHKFQGIINDRGHYYLSKNSFLSLDRHLRRSKFDDVNPQPGRNRKKRAVRGCFPEGLICITLGWTVALHCAHSPVSFDLSEISSYLWLTYILFELYTDFRTLWH